jgi:drug/metabolite transporter (DMT)-like permease
MAASNSTIGLTLALVSAASFSTAGTFARSLTEAGWSPGAEVIARVGCAAALLLVPGVIALRGRWSVFRRSFPTIAIYGIVTIAGCQLCYFNAVEHLSIGVALLLEYLGIVLIVGYLWLRHGQRPQRLTAIGSAIALAGLVLVIDLFGGARLDPIGVIWALGGAVGLATYFVISGNADDGVPPLVLAGGGMIVGAVALLALGALDLLPMHATFGRVGFAGHRVAWWFPVVGLSLVAAALAYVAGIGAARRLGPRLASFLGLIEVVFAILVAWLLLDELPTSMQLGGGALIVAGVALVRVDELRRAASDPADHPTVDEQALTGDVGRVGRGQECDGPRELLDPARPRHRDARDGRSVDRVRVDEPG